MCCHNGAIRCYFSTSIGTKLPREIKQDLFTTSHDLQYYLLKRKHIGNIPTLSSRLFFVCKKSLFTKFSKMKTCKSNTCATNICNCHKYFERNKSV